MNKTSGQYSNIYKFGLYTVETAQRVAKSSIKINKNGKGFYISCSDNGVEYTQVDTLALNNDDIPDFVYAYRSKEYTTIGLLVSTTDSIKYKKLDVKFMFEPAKKNMATYRAFILKDVNNDGYKDLVLNVLQDKTGNYHPIKKSSDTVNYLQLKHRAEGKITNTEFEGIYFDKNKFHTEH